MLINRIEKEEFIFSIFNEGKKVIIQSWVESGYAAYYEPLQELVDNGYGTIQGDEYHIPFLSIYELDTIEREILELPSTYPFELYIQSSGLITKANFQYTYSFCSFAPNGDRYKYSLNGPVISLDLSIKSLPLQDYLLTRDQYCLIAAIDEFNQIEEKTKHGNLIKFTEIKELSEEAATVLDSTLAKKNVILPAHIKIGFEYKDGQLEVIPTISSEDGEKFTHSFDAYKQVQKVYPIRSKSRGKTHVLLNEEQQEVLKKIKEKYRIVSDPKVIEKIVDSPESVFGTECVDFSDLYSDRVITIGLYKPKVYPFISPYKSQWIPGFSVEDKKNGTSNIAIKDYQELSSLKEAIDTSKASNAKTVEYKGVQIPVDRAEQIEIDAKNQLDKNEPVTEFGPNSLEGKKKSTKVLIIKENTDDLDYSAMGKTYELPEKLKLLDDKYLEKDITLKNHQEQGVAWLQNLLTSHQKGCLLADDMGLGKTLQLLYLIDWHFRNYRDNQNPYLVVAPVSLLENWEREYKRFFVSPRLPILTISSAPQNQDKSFVDNLSAKQIVLVSYETMRRAQLNFGAVNFAIVVLDEAQKIKTPSTLVTNAAKALKCDFRVAMTGTPIENTFMDLWCIIDFSIPGLLGNAKQFAKNFSYPLKKRETDVQAIGNKIRDEVGGYFLRRLKVDIADELPKKETVYIKVQMPELQLIRYRAAMDRPIDKTKFGKDNMLFRIMQIRKLSDHPFLENDDISAYSEEQIITSSAKMIATFQILDSIKSKQEKVIIFSISKSMQRMLQHTVYYKYGINPRIVNGDTSTKSGHGNNLSRQQTIDAFQETEGFNVIIMSPLAAGMGLNVVGANHVIHYSRHWNPAKEMQATDRVYRIGQTKDVKIYYPMAISADFDTFDVVLEELLNRKMNLSTSALYPSEMLEVDKEDLFTTIFGKQSEQMKRPLTMEDVHRMDEFLFEAFVGAVYEKKGFEIYLTKRSGDKGIDVMVRGDDIVYVIQCKHSKNNVGGPCVGEVVSGSKYYQVKYNEEKLSYKSVVVTNSKYTAQAIEMAEANEVQMLEGSFLEEAVQSYNIFWEDVYRLEENRLK